VTKPSHPAVYFPPVIAAFVLVALGTLHVVGVNAPFVQGALFVVGLSVLGFAFLDMLVHDVRRTALHPIAVRAAVIGFMVIETVLLFALTYLSVAGYDGEMRGMSTMLDAVYFTMTTLMTIGFGDIAAQGQLARGVVLTQMFFSVLVLSASVRLLSSLTRGVTREVGHPTHERRD
jgi:voltage-gated potassium channel